MRVAILDLGTNTFNLLIGENGDDEINFLYRGREIVKLGEGGLRQNRISEAAWGRAEEAISKHMEIIKEHNCSDVKAFATSGIRSTDNGIDLLNHLSSTFSLDAEVISGDREAELIWKGVSMTMDIEEPILIMDIGGGSTEFILADSSGILWKESYKLGASRLKENFTPSDPIMQEEVIAMNEHFAEQLSELYIQCDQVRPNKLVGSSGSFDTFTEMYLHRVERSDEFDMCDLHTIPYHSFIESFDFLLDSTLSERLETPGIIPMRADMIVISALLTKHVLDHTHIRDVRLSKFALKEGAMAEVLSRK